jgi:hypothetical protein
VETYIDAVTDLDGDGNAEIVLHSMQKQFISGNNPGRPNDPPNVRYYHDKTVWILDSELRPVANYLIAVESKRSDLRIATLPRKNGPGANLLVITDHAMLLEWGNPK